MLNYDNILSLMTKHFPRWMDIRKRVQKSNGGKYLQSVANEVVSVQEAIDEYKQEFFIENYENKYDDIPYLAYYIEVGDISTLSIKFLDNPYNEFFEAMDEKEFYSTRNTYYYEDNKLFFKSNDVSNPKGAIRYEYNETEHTQLLKEYYIWNVYDEFAAFVGLVRFVDENNEELTDRILNVFKMKPNSTEEGLQNAIIIDTLDFIHDAYPNLTIEDVRQKIIIERPSPENLIEKYNDFSTILDELAKINRDVYRTKTWDKDLWQFELASIDYLPHTWDIVLSAYANGIGFKDDLEASFIDSNDDQLTATVTVYTQDEESLETYLKNNSVTKNIEYDIIKTNTKNADINYTIFASHPIRINDSINNIKFIISNETGDIEKTLGDVLGKNINAEYDGIYYGSSIEHFIIRQGEIQPSDKKIPEPKEIVAAYDDKTINIEKSVGYSDSVSFEFSSVTVPSDVSDEHKFIRIIFKVSENCNIESSSINDTSVNHIEKDDTYITKPIVFEGESLSINIECQPKINAQPAGDGDTVVEQENITYSCSIKSIEFYASEYSAYKSHGDFPDDTSNLNKWEKYEPQSRDKETYSIRIDYDKLINCEESNNNNISVVNHISVVNEDGSNLDFTPVFVTDNNGINEYHQSYDYDGKFSYIYFYPKDPIQYISYNTITVTSDSTESVPIINNFTPAVSLSTELIYNIVSDDDISISFNNDAENPIQWSLGNKSFSIYLKDKNKLSEQIEHYSENIKLKSIKTDFSTHLEKEGKVIEEKDDIISYTDGVSFEYNNDDKKWYVTIDISDLYKLVSHTILAYKTKDNKPISTKDKDVQVDGDSYIFRITDYITDYNKNTDIITVSNLESPQFLYTIDDNNIKFYKIPDYQSKIAIRCGYYYIGDKEYYLFSNHDDKNNTNHGSSEITYNNTYLENGEIVLNKTNVNYIKNSRMNLSDNIEDIYYLDTVSHSEKITYNHLGSLSTCNNLYSKWHSFGADLSLHSYGENNKETGIKIAPHFNNAYAYIDITSIPSCNYYISMYTHGDLRAKIVREKKYRDVYGDSLEYISFDDSVNTEHVVDLENDDYCHGEYYQELDYDYYLVVYCPNGINSQSPELFFDDILIIDSADKNLLKHQKNISLLGVAIAEQTVNNDYHTRLYFDKKYATYNNSSIDEDGFLLNSSQINWGLTKIFSLSNAEDFNKLQKKNNIVINNTYNYLYTGSTDGFIMTDSINIGNPAIIKDLVVELNDIPFNNMSNFDIILYTSNSKDGIYVPIGSPVSMKYNEQNHTGYNIGNFNCENLVGNYIKLYVAIAKNTILGDITLYAKYKSDENNAPVETVSAGGTMVTSILDAHYSGKYIIDNINFIGDCKEFEIHMRAYVGENVWTEWKPIEINNNGKIQNSNTPEFVNARFFQVMIRLTAQDSSVKLNHIDIRKIG